MELINRTPFAAQHVVTPDARGREVLLAVLKATFNLDSGMTPAEQQLPVVLADKYLDEPGASSLLQASDLALRKPGADVILQGCAYPQQLGDRQVDVTLRCDRIQKTVRVFGDRVWSKGMMGYRATPPAPIEKVPLVYERAFGGADLSVAETPGWWGENPVGCGFSARGTKKEFEGAAVPNLVRPDQEIDKPVDSAATACFSWVAPQWSPRVGFAGTYDDAWLRNVMPLLPRDFDERFFQAAPADQILPGYVQGGESVEISGVAAGAVLRFSLPRPAIELSVNLGDDLLIPPLVCDTVLIDTELRHVAMTWRSCLDIHGRIDELHWLAFEGDAP